MSDSVVSVVGRAPIIGGWVLVTYGRKSCLEPAEISSCVLLFKFKNGGCRVREVGKWWGWKLGGSWFYSRVGDAG